MENSSLTDRFTLQSRDYLLKTIDDDKVKRIVVKFFREGKASYTSEVSYDDNLSESERQELTIAHHEKHKEEINRLFQLHLDEGIPPAENQLRYLRAHGLIKFGLFQEAAADLQSLLANQGDTPQVRIALGKVYLKMHKYRPAAEQFLQALSENSQYADLHFYSGVCLYYSENCVEAIQSFSRTLRLNPHYGEAHFYAALTLLLNVRLAQEYRLAKGLPERVLQLLSNSREMLPLLSAEAIEQGIGLVTDQKYEEAFEVLAPLAAGLESGTTSLFNYAFYLDVLLEPEQIASEQVWQEITRLEELVVRHPHYADLYYDLGFAYVILGANIAARSLSYMNKALTVNPAYQDAQRAITLLENNVGGLRETVHTLLPLRL